MHIVQSPKCAPQCPVGIELIKLPAQPLCQSRGIGRAHRRGVHLLREAHDLALAAGVLAGEGGKRTEYGQKEENEPAHLILLFYDTFIPNTYIGIDSLCFSYQLYSSFEHPEHNPLAPKNLPIGQLTHEVEPEKLCAPAAHGMQTDEAVDAA